MGTTFSRFLLVEIHQGSRLKYITEMITGLWTRKPDWKYISLFGDCERFGKGVVV